MNWAKNKLRADIIVAASSSITADGNIVIPYAAATAAQRNTWMVNNADRVLFGHIKANAVSGVYATALLTARCCHRQDGAQRWSRWPSASAHRFIR